MFTGSIVATVTPMKDGKLDERSLRTKLEKYKFYHTIPLTENLSTPGQVFPNEAVSLRALRSVDVAGKRVLDIGCRDGDIATDPYRQRTFDTKLTLERRRGGAGP